MTELKGVASAAPFKLKLPGHGRPVWGLVHLRHDEKQVICMDCGSYAVVSVDTRSIEILEVVGLHTKRYHPNRKRPNWAISRPVVEVTEVPF